MLISSNTMEIKSNIQNLREKVGLTRRALAHKIGVTENTIYNWETGKNGLDTINNLIQLCKFLNCNLDDLISPEPSSVDTTLQASTNTNDSLQSLRELLGTEKISSSSEIKPAINEIEIADQE